MRNILVVLLTWFACVTAVQAQISDDERARLHFESGRSYYDQARYDDAAREFGEAFKLSGRAALLLNISQAHERALRFDPAISEIQRYLQLVPDAPDRKALEERIARLEELRTRVQTTPGAEPAAPAPAPAPGTEPPPQAAPLPAPAPAAPPTVDAPGNPLLVPGVVLISSGGALLLGSLVTGLMAHDKYSSLERRCVNSVCPSGAQNKIDSGETLAVVSTVLMGVGIAAAGVGVALLLVGAADEQEPAPLAAGQIRLGPAPTPLGLGAQLAF